MRFLVDTQLPAALARWLREKGHSADHVLEIGLAQSKDTLIWQYAHDQRAVIVTKDEDFAEITRSSRPGPAVVWLRIGNSSTPVLLAWLELLLPRIVLQLEKGDRLVEVR